MSSNSETKILENKPYLTKKEVGLLLGKNGRNLDKKISHLLKKNYLTSLKKGLYVPNALLKTQEKLPAYLANVLYYPSYLSLEYVLQKEGVIPETVFVYTSVTMKLTRIFKNNLGIFTYRKIKSPLFTGYQERLFRENYRVKIATKTKAIFDFLYFKVFRTSLEQELFSDLRINWETFSKQDLDEFKDYVNLAGSKKMEKIYHLLQKKLKPITT